MTSTSLDLDNPQQPSHQVAANLRAEIASGSLPVGQRLKSVRDLAREYGVSTGTVQQALRALRAEGLITTWQGRGTFVRARKEDLPEGSLGVDTSSEVIGRLDQLSPEQIAILTATQDVTLALRRTGQKRQRGRIGAGGATSTGARSAVRAARPRARPRSIRRRAVGECG